MILLRKYCKRSISLMKTSFFFFWEISPIEHAFYFYFYFYFFNLHMSYYPKRIKYYHNKTMVEMLIYIYIYIYICGAGEFEVPTHFTLRAQDPGRGNLLLRMHNESPKKTQGCGRGRSHAQHLTRHLKKNDEFNARTRQMKKLPML